MRSTATIRVACGVRAITLIALPEAGWVQCFAECAGKLRAYGVDGQLRIGADTGGKNRAVEHVQILQVVIATARVDRGPVYVGTDRAAAHDVGADDGRDQRG